MRASDDTDVSAALDWATQTIGLLVDVRELSGGLTSTMLPLTTETHVGFLPPPGKQPFSFLQEARPQDRIEERLRRALTRALAN